MRPCIGVALGKFDALLTYALRGLSTRLVAPMRVYGASVGRVKLNFHATRSVSASGIATSNSTRF